MHVIRGLGTGGTEMMCLRLARHWQHRFDQSVFAWAPEPRTLQAEFNAIANLTLILPPSDCGRTAPFLRTTVARCSPDALLIHIFGRPHIATAFAARAAGVRRVAVWAGNPPPDVANGRRRWSAILIASRLLRCPVISCSDAVEAGLLELGSGLPAGSARISNGIDIDAIARQASVARAPGSGPNFVIGMVARLNEIKDHETLLRAFSLLRNVRTDVELWIIGDGPLRGRLEERAMWLGISTQTRFLGERTDVPHLLAQMDAFVFSTTRDEGFGIALIEAMAAGVPIVASDVAACREVLANGKAGVLVPPADGQALARALDDLLKNSDRRRLLIECGRRHVRQKYGIERCAAKWEKVLFASSDIDDIASTACAF